MKTRPLDEREARAWRGFQAMREQLISHLARELNRDSGLTEADYACLVHLSEAPDHRIRARDLGRQLGWDRSRLSHQIARMEARGTIKRAPCQDDLRGYDVVLTNKGLSAIESAAPGHLAAVRHCFADVLTKTQLDAFADAAEAVLRHLEEEHPPESG